MKKIAGLIFGLFSLSVNATVLNFDDINLVRGNYVSINTLLPTYGGFTWGSSWAVGNLQANPNYINAAHSGTQYLSNSGGASNLLVQRASAFTFDGAWFKTPTVNNPASSWVKITAYDAFNNLIGTTGNVGVSTNSLWIAPGFKNVSRLNIEQAGGWFTMDDFTFDTVTQKVPEPAPLAVIGLALIGLIVARKKQVAV